MTPSDGAHESGTAGPGRTWHHGLVAQWWANFNDDFRGHELDYFRSQIDLHGGPVLDAGCGTGRLLRPLLAAGVDIDGVDVSADMVAACRDLAAREGLAPNLWVQPLDELDLPRTYRTILVVGTFGLGSTRARDVAAVARLHEHLEPGGTLLVDLEMPWVNARLWRLWTVEGRESLPEDRPKPGARRLAPDGAEYSLCSWVTACDPLAQQVTMRIAAQRWRDGELETSEEHDLDIGMYFAHEMVLLLEQAGFVDVTMHGEHEARPATADDDFVVFVARRAG